MNQTEQVFLSLLRDYVCGHKLKALPTVDWQALYNLAQSHNVTGLVGRILADLPTDHRPPKALAVAFRQGMGQTLMAYEKRMAAVQVMEQTLTDAQIPYLTVKGACTAAVYPDPPLRTSGDTDIVLTPDNQQKAVQALEQRGFAKKVTHDDVVMLTLHGFEFELHTRLESINDGSRALLANPFAPEVAYNKSKNIWVLQPVYAVYYTVLHLLHHIKTGGAGVRMLLDTDLLLRKDPTLAPQVLELAERSGLERSFGCILALCKQWLDTPLPCSVPALDTDTVEKFAAVILGGGVFDYIRGLDDRIKAKPCPDGALDVAEKLGVQPCEVLYIGDSGVDMQTALNAGFTSCGVLWGFRTEKELRDNGAKYIARKPADILEIMSK